jgi:hypothetical protein
VSKIATTVSPVLAALFVAAGTARSLVDTHQREVLDVPAPEGMGMADRHKQVDDNNALNNAAAEAQYAIAQHPAETMRDLSGKLEYMVKESMGDGMDWLPTILEDVQRIEPTETPEWSAALKAYEEATANDLAAGKALSAAEDAHQEDPHAEAVRALVKAEALRNEAMDVQCAAIRALTNTPAPSLSALLVNMQIAIDTGMIGNTDINDALATDLRRFSHYADKEA